MNLSKRVTKELSVGQVASRDHGRVEEICGGLEVVNDGVGVVGNGGALERDFAAWILDSGMRLGETLALQLGDIDAAMQAGLVDVRNLFFDRGERHVRCVHKDAAGETGTPGVKSTSDGWMNRHLAHVADHRDTPFRGVAIGPQLPRALRGTTPTLAITSLRNFGIR